MLRVSLSYMMYDPIIRNFIALAHQTIAPKEFDTSNLSRLNLTGITGIEE